MCVRVFAHLNILRASQTHPAAQPPPSPRSPRSAVRRPLGLCTHPAPSRLLLPDSPRAAGGQASPVSPGSHCPSSWSVSNVQAPWPRTGQPIQAKAPWTSTWQGRLGYMGPGGPPGAQGGTAMLPAQCSAPTLRGPSPHPDHTLQYHRREHKGTPRCPLGPPHSFPPRASALSPAQPRSPPFPEAKILPSLHGHFLSHAPSPQQRRHHSLPRAPLALSRGRRLGSLKSSPVRSV